MLLAFYPPAGLHPLPYACSHVGSRRTPRMKEGDALGLLLLPLPGSPCVPVDSSSSTSVNRLLATTIAVVPLATETAQQIYCACAYSIWPTGEGIVVPCPRKPCSSVKSTILTDVLKGIPRDSGTPAACSLWQVMSWPLEADKGTYRKTCWFCCCCLYQQSCKRNGQNYRRYEAGPSSLARIGESSSFLRAWLSLIAAAESLVTPRMPRCSYRITFVLTKRRISLVGDGMRRVALSQGSKRRTDREREKEQPNAIFAFRLQR